MGRQSIGRQNRQRVLNEIIKHKNEGIAFGRLWKTLTIDPKTARHHLTALRSEGLVIRNEGKFGLWFPTEKVYSDTMIGAQLFGEDSLDKLLNTRVLSNEVSFFSGEIACNNTRYFRPHFDGDKDWIEMALFELANRLGAFVIFAAIQAMNKANRHLLNTVSKEYFLERDRKIADWFYRVVDPYHLLWKITTTVKRNYLPDKEENPKESTYELNDIAIKQLLSAFANLYPSMNRELTGSFAGMQSRVNSWKEWLAMVRESEEKRKSGRCSHQKKYDARIFDLKMKQIHCPDCGAWWSAHRKDWDKIDAIEAAVVEKFGDSQNVGFCKEIQYIFEYNGQKLLRLADVINLWLKHRPEQRISDSARFLQVLTTILNILVEADYIKTKNHHADPDQVLYIRYS